MRHLITFSGGVTSAKVCDIVLNKIPESEIIFTDTGWEHPDLFRFMDNLEKRWDRKITILKDDRYETPEDLFYDKRFLGSNRVPLCSRVLKAELMQKYTNQGDILYFGIDNTEKHRATRISKVYEKFKVTCIYPLIEQNIDKQSVIDEIENEWNIKIPILYKMGFAHNNCSGGCVRQGKAGWLHLLKTYPDIYRDRERVENEMSEYLGKRVTYLKDKSLEELRQIHEKNNSLDFGQQESFECMGICNTVF